MERRWRQTASMVTLSVYLIEVFTFALLSFSHFALSQDASPIGTDSGLLARAKAGDPSSEFAVGRAYAKGEGVPQDYAQAVLWFRKAAEQGDVKAEYALGVSYYKGLGVPQDKSEGISWFRKAADQGDAKAQYALGYHYQHYFGVGEDHAQSELWYRKAAEQGFAKAEYELGDMYYKGDGVPQDESLAEMWTQKAADQGDADAQKLLLTLAAIKTKRREEMFYVILTAISVVLIWWLASAMFRNRERLLNRGKRLIPRTSRTRQLAVLLLVASWCSICCLYQAFDPWMMRHPIDAVATTLLFSAPAIIFGAVCLWWLSQANKGS